MCFTRPFKPTSIAFDSALTFFSEKFKKLICYQRRHEPEIHELCECPDVLQKVKDVFIPIKYVAGLNLSPQICVPNGAFHEILAKR